MSSMVCYRCGSDHVNHHGYSAHGDPRFICKNCGRTFQIRADRYIDDRVPKKTKIKSKYSNMSIEELDREVEKLNQQSEELRQGIREEAEKLEGKTQTNRIENPTTPRIKTNSISRASSKNKYIAIFLLLLNAIGIAGLHRFYVGKKKTGILYLLTFGIFGLGSIYDLVLLIQNKLTDKIGAVLLS